MKKAFLMAAAAAAMLLPAILPADPSKGSGSARYSSSRHRRSPSRQTRRHWGFGFGSSWGWWGYPYYGYPAYYGYYGHYGRYGRPYGSYPSPDWAAIDTDVSPEGARTFLDGKLIGTADDFDGHPDFLYLKRGRYAIEFRLDGYDSRTIEIQARPGMKLQIEESLRKIPGSKQYGSYEPVEPEGGVRRFWGKKSDRAESVDDEEEIYGALPERREREMGEEDEDDKAEVRPSGRTGEDDEDGEAEVRPRERERESREEWRKSRRPAATADKRRESSATTRLRFRVEPADAAVYLDDRFVGTAEEVNSLSRGISVSAGKHTVTVSRPGFEDRSVEVEVDSGETEELKVELER